MSLPAPDANVTTGSSITDSSIVNDSADGGPEHAAREVTVCHVEAF